MLSCSDKFEQSLLLAVNFFGLKYLFLFSLGLRGFPGITGSPGSPGQRGYPGTPAPSRGFFYTRHSQNVIVPECPGGTELMWSGYSLLYIQGNERAHGQDLGLKEYIICIFLEKYVFWEQPIFEALEFKFYIDVSFLPHTIPISPVIQLNSHTVMCSLLASLNWLTRILH